MANIKATVYYHRMVPQSQKIKMDSKSTCIPISGIIHS